MANPVPVAPVQNVSTNVAATTGSIVQAITVTNATDTLIACIINTTQTSGYAASVVSGAGAQWYLGQSTAGTVGCIDIWYGLNASQGAASVSISLTGALPTAGCTVIEFSGMPLTGPVIETTAVGTATTNAPALALTPANLGDVIVVFTDGVAQTSSPSSPWTQIAGPTTATVQKNGIAYQVVSTVNAQTATWGTATSSKWTAVGVILKAAQPTGYGILNATSASINAGYSTPQASPDYVDSIITAAGSQGTGVLSGCAVSPAPAGFFFQVATGTALLNYAPITVSAAASVAITAANGSNPRRDLIYVNSTGTIVYTAGTPAAIPCIPTLPIECVPLATIEVPTSASVISYPGTSSTAYVNDKRVVVGFAPSMREYYEKASGVLFESVLRSNTDNNGQAPGTGTLWMTGITLPAGLTIGHLGFTSDTTAASVPSHWWFGLFDNNRNLLAITADQTSTAWAANTTQSLAIATTAQGSQASFITTYTGLHYLGVLVAATTVPTLVAQTQVNGPPGNIAPVLGGSSSGSLSTPPAFPFQAGAITFQVSRYYATVSV